MNSLTPRKRPLIPDGTELWIGLVVGAVIGIWLLPSDYPTPADGIIYIVAILVAIGGAVLAFGVCVLGIQFWSEDDRMYWRGVTLKFELQRMLKDISVINSRKDIADGLGNAVLIMDELMKQKPTRMYGGMHELAPHVRRFATLYWEYVDVLKHPLKAGAKYAELMKKGEEGFQGFAEQMARMLERVNSNDVFEMTTSAELLRSLRNLLSTSNTK